MTILKTGIEQGTGRKYAICRIGRRVRLALLSRGAWVVVATAVVDWN